jgi:uncharacterized protein involved in exopolysaccharide biosynthesis
MRGGSPVERDTTMRDLLAVVFKRKWLILSVFVVAVTFVSIQTLSSPVTYTADSTLLLSRAGLRSSVLDRAGKSLPWVEVVESEIEVVRSTPVLQLAIEKLASPSDGEAPIDIAFDRIQKSVKAGVIGESNVVYVSSTARDPERAVRVANAVAESYEVYHRRLFKLPDASLAIRAQIDSMALALDEFRTRRAAILETVGLTDIREEERSIVHQRTRSRQELSTIDVNMSRLESEMADVESFLATDFESGQTIPFQVNMSSSQGSSLTFEIKELHERTRDLDQLLNKYTEQHPAVREARAKVEQSRVEVREIARSVLMNRRSELRIAEGEAVKLRWQVAELDRTLLALPEVNRQLESLDAAIDATELQHGDYLKQIVAAEINSASVAEDGVTILSPAIKARRNAKGDAVRLALGPILALIAGIGLAFYLENMDHSLRNREDVEQHLEIPVLASFPEVDVGDRTPSGRGRRSLPFQKRAKE